MMSHKQRIFIAGATGTLGMPLVRALVAQGYTVIGLTRSPGKQALLEQAGASSVVADVMREQDIERALRLSSPEWVVNLLTAIPKNGPTRYSHMAATNELRVKGTENLLRASIAAGVRRIVGESMVFAYGFGDHGEAAKVESDPLQSKEANAELQVIVGALRSLEEQFLVAHHQGKIEAIPLRYGLFYGPESPSTQYMLRMINKRFFPTPSGSSGILSWIHIEDAMQATIAALEYGQSGEIYNIVDDCPVSLNDWAGYAAQLLKVKPPLTVPPWLIQRVMPYVGAFSSARLPVSNEKAKRDLRWHLRFPTYKDGLKEIVANAATSK